MMDGHEINIAYLQARLDPQVVFIIDVPCAGMAYHVAIVRLHEQRSLPECLRKRREAHRDEEILAVLQHAFGIKILGFQQRRPVYRSFSSLGSRLAPMMFSIEVMSRQSSGLRQYLPLP